MPLAGNSFGTRDKLNVGAQAFEVHRLETLEKQPDWATQFRFQSLLTTSTNWTPEPVEPDPEQAFISDYEEEDAILG